MFPYCTRVHTRHVHPQTSVYTRALPWHASGHVLREPRTPAAPHSFPLGTPPSQPTSSRLPVSLQPVRFLLTPRLSHTLARSHPRPCGQQFPAAPGRVTTAKVNTPAPLHLPHALLSPQQPTLQGAWRGGPEGATTPGTRLAARLAWAQLAATGTREHRGQTPPGFPHTAVVRLRT